MQRTVDEFIDASKNIPEIRFVRFQEGDLFASLSFKDNKSCMIFFNQKRGSIVLYGLYELLHGESSKDVYKLEEHFADPLLPTKLECQLFEIEYGYEFPIKGKR